MSEERILLKFIVGQRVVKQGEDSRFEGEVVACFVKRNLKTVRYVVENDEGVLHIASERQLQLAMPASGADVGDNRTASPDFYRSPTPLVNRLQVTNC
jgi:hypothetical protein